MRHATITGLKNSRQLRNPEVRRSAGFVQNLSIKRMILTAPDNGGSSLTQYCMTLSYMLEWVSLQEVADANQCQTG